jgi:hypothetical protein
VGSDAAGRFLMLSPPSTSRSGLEPFGWKTEEAIKVIHFGFVYKLLGAPPRGGGAAREIRSARGVGNNFSERY